MGLLIALVWRHRLMQTPCSICVQAGRATGQRRAVVRGLDMLGRARLSDGARWLGDTVQFSCGKFN